MKKESKKEVLQNAVSFYLPKKYFIHPSDSRLGNKFAIAEIVEHGAVQTHSAYMTYDEMNAYLRGFGNVDRLEHKESQI